MKARKIIWGLGAVYIGLASCGYSYNLKKGNRSYNDMAYHDATNYYFKAFSKDTSYEAISGLARSYRMMNDADLATGFYSRVVTYPESVPQDKFEFARLLMQSVRYDEARYYFKAYLDAVGSDIVAEMLIASCNSVGSFLVDTTLYTLNKVNTPGTTGSFSQIPYGDGIVFSGSTPEFRGNKQNPWTGNSYLDLYFTQKDASGKWISPVLLKGQVNGQYHEGPATFNKEGDVVFFTRSNYTKRKLKTGEGNVNVLKIYRAEKKGDAWKNIQEVPFNSEDHSVGHPSLSANGTVLYFVSDAPGGFGGTDIYRARYENGSWSAPENLGKTINTPGNEMFPYFHEDGTLYFSSDAHNNMGGLDVFMTSEVANKWLEPENLNYPLNSSKDDFAYVLNKDNQTGYVSSNRTNKDEIYEFRKNPPTLIVKGTAYKKGTKDPVADARIEVRELSSREVIVATTDAKGQYQVGLKNGHYFMLAKKDMFFADDDSVSTLGQKISNTYERNFELEAIIIEKPIVLENIYYDLDKWFIREDAAIELNKLVKIMNENPEIVIELGSHTDSRASYRYNNVLSDKRAKAAVEHISSRGIAPERMTWKGYGETKLVNHCTNGVECEEELHQQNRRTEFKVISIKK